MVNYVQNHNSDAVMAMIIFLIIFTSMSCMNLYGNINSPSYLQNKRSIPLIKERHEVLQKYSNLRL